MLHPRTLEYESTRNFNFKDCFKEVIPLFKKADYVIGNLETTFAGNLEIPKKRSGVFNAPDNFLNILKDIGITHLGNFNNHTFDFGIDGFQRTYKLINDSKITYLPNTFNDDNANILTYTTHINNLEDKRITIPENALLSTMNQDYLACQDKINVAFVHWGGQYLNTPNAEQLDHEKMLLNNNYQLIIGNGNHSPLPTIVKDNKLIAYCLGDFFSSHDKPNSTDLGKILEVDMIGNKIISVKEYLTKTITDIKGFSQIHITESNNLH